MLTIDQTLEQAIACHQVGQLQEAEQHYRAVLQVQAKHPDANHNMGVLLVQLKQFEEGLRYFWAALEADPTAEQFWLSYIDALYQSGRLEEALLTLEHARNMGLQGDAVDLLAARLKLLAQISAEDLKDTHTARATKNKPEKQLKSTKKSTPSKEKYPEPIEISGLVKLFNEARYAELIDLAQSMTARFPKYGFGWKALGTAYKQLGHRELALAALQKAVALAPKDAESHSNLAITFQELGQFKQAERSCRRALQIKPSLIEAHINLGISLASLGRTKDAEASYLNALKIDPSCSEALNGLAILLKEIGQIKAAESLFLQALEAKPDNLKIRYSLALATQVNAENTNFASLVNTATLAQNGELQLGEEEQVFLHFALGKCYDDIGNYPLAFSHFQAACKLKRSTIHYDADRFTRQIDEVIRIFDKTTLSRLSGAGNSSQLPIFILGMPRSGTTLVEQIVASHPDVYAAGELTDLMNIVHSSAVAFPDELHTLDQETLAVWAADYLAGLEPYAPDALRIIDKMPGNFIALGLIHLMLPGAKIIHVNRNPADTCVSCFSQFFTDSAHEYSYDLTELSRYYLDYSRLIDHWRTVLPASAFLEVDYEALVEAPESQARRLIEYCGLEWDDACLTFYKNRSPVRTASVVQVRKPIYQLAVGRWRNYEKFLGPLLDVLGNLVTEQRDGKSI